MVKILGKDEQDEREEFIKRQEAIAEMQRVHSYRSMVGSVAGHIIAGSKPDLTYQVDTAGGRKEVDAAVNLAECIIQSAFTTQPPDSFQL
jgi:hypothetical protein